MIAQLLAFSDRIPNQQAIEAAPTMGWLLLGCAVLVSIFLIIHAEKWRRWWLTTEDPRAIAVFRIVFTFFVIANINGMWELFEFLYTDEGIFTADVARQVFAAQQFAGFGDGLTREDPWGFYDAAAVWEFLKGPKWSLLFFWDSPTFFWVHLAAFHLAALGFLVGFRTRTMGIATWFLMNSILVRNHLAWEGTEIVYRCLLAYLVLARSGHAYSVDNWLRRKKLRKLGLLSERDGPGAGAGAPPSAEHPHGLEPVFRPIPSWPRKLLMLQIATIYLTTGSLKTGSVWMSGDSLYYAVNLDHFYRLPPQLLSSLSGTTVFRAMTYAVKVGQMMFPLVVVGIIVRWVIAQSFPPLSVWQRWLQRGCFFGLIASTTAIVWVAWPLHFTPAIPAWGFACIWVGTWIGLWLLWRKLAYKPFVVRRILRWNLPDAAIIDRAWVCRWIIGRRVLLVWHIAFHAHIFTLMNVGQFQTGMLSGTFVFFTGPEIATMLRDIGHRLARWGVPWIPAASAAGMPVVPEADPNACGHRGRNGGLPQWSLALGLASIVAAVLVEVWFHPRWDFRLIWLGTALGLGAVGWWTHRTSTAAPTAGARTSQPQWAYGPLGRLLVGGLIAWQIAAVATWLLPDKDCLSSFHAKSRNAFAFWLTRTTTDQGWGMFAPNPPRSNVFLKVLVTDAQGEVWDLKTDVYAAEQKPIPWIWNTRLRKMNRRIIGGESGPNSWYRKWYARYECRQWAREHDGEAPEKVELVKLWYSIPTPEQTRDKGYYVAEDRLERNGFERVAHSEICRQTVMGQLPNFIRERDGLPVLEPGEYRPWIKHKRSKWQKRRAAENR